MPLHLLDNLSNLSDPMSARTTLGLATTDSPTFANGTFTTGNIATSQPLTQTWTTSATYTGMRVNITDSGPSNSASPLMDLQVGGVSRFNVSKSGITNISDSSGVYKIAIAGNSIFSKSTNNKVALWLTPDPSLVGLASDVLIGWSSTASTNSTFDLAVLRDAANTLAQRNGTNAQTSRIYNTFTSATNNQRSTFTWANSAFVIGTETNSSLPLSSQPSAAPIIIAPGYNVSLSATAPVVLQQTWNNTANTFTLLSANVIDTASNSASLLMDLQVGGVSRFSISKSGLPNFTNDIINWGASGSVRFFTSLGSYISFEQSNGNSIPFGYRDTLLNRDAANTLAQRNGLNPQEFRLYNRFNNASDYERFFIKTNVGATSATQIGLSADGTGQNRNLEFVTGGSTRMTIASGGIVTTTQLVAQVLQTTGNGIYAGETPIRLGVNNSMYFRALASSDIVSLTTSSGGTNYCDLALRNLTASGTVQTGGYTFATLPTPATIGMRTYITDGAASPGYMANAAGGGSTVTPVFYNGSAWINC